MLLCGPSGSPGLPVMIVLYGSFRKLGLHFWGSLYKDPTI